MLPSVVHVYESLASLRAGSHGKEQYEAYEVVDGFEEDVLVAGPAPVVAAWLKQHSYVCTWTCCADHGLYGHYTRKERVTC